MIELKQKAYPKCTYLRLIQAFVSRSGMNNRFKAVSELVIADLNKPPMTLEFWIYKYKMCIEGQMQD